VVAPVVPVVVVPRVPPWNTIYAGFAVGGEQLKDHWTGVVGGGFPAADNPRMSAAAFVYGGQIGFTRQRDRLVFGAEAAIDGPGVTARAASTTTPATISYSTRVGWLLTGAVKLGHAVDNSLYYLQGGVAVAEVTTSQNNGVTGFSQASTRTGWTVGGGWAQVVGTWIFGIDYKYVDLGTYSVSGTPTVTNIQPRIQVVTFRASYKIR
jgi:hypothetical protein